LVEVDVDKLHPYVGYLTRRLLADGKKQGLELKVIETIRTQSRQTQIFKDGNGPSLIGPHGYGLAVDVVPLKNGKIDWKKSIGYNVKFIYDNIEG
jgi:hypothetical protein